MCTTTNNNNNNNNNTPTTTTVATAAAVAARSCFFSYGVNDFVLADYYLRPFERAIRGGGARGIM